MKKAFESFLDWLECKLAFRRRRKEARRKRRGENNVGRNNKCSGNHFTIIDLK